MRAAFWLMLVVAFGWLAGPAVAQKLDTGDLAITTAAGPTYHFTVEVAKTPDQQERGLMFRKEMAPDAGMIFPNEQDRTTSFWMHNTYIPLDMLFIKGDGQIAHIVADAKPMSDDLISSGGPVRAVLELNGGTTAKLGIHVGDRVGFPGLGGT